MEFIVYTFSYTQGKYFAFKHVYCSILSQSFGKVVCEREATVNKVYSIISADAYMIGFECRCFAAASRASCVFSL